jgi:hypothetical protein
VKEIFLQLSVVKLLALSFKENVEFFATFELVPHTSCSWAVNEVSYSSPTDMDFQFP